MMAFEEAILKGRSQFNELLAGVEGSGGGQAIHDTEQALWSGLMDLGLTLLQASVARHGDGDVGETLTADDGRVLRRSARPHERRYVSVFGEFEFGRFVYSERESQLLEVRPLDARLALPDSEFSLLLQKWSQGFCAKIAFGEATESLRSILGLDVTVRTQERLNRQAAADVEAFREGLAVPAPETEGEILVVAVDCKGVPMVRTASDGPSKEGNRRRKGEKKTKKKMAAVAAIYSIDEHPRSAEDVLDETLREQSDAKRPRPKNKRVRAEMTRVEEDEEINGKDHVLGWARREIDARTSARNSEEGSKTKPVVCILDGERALWKRVLALFPFAVFIIDLYHVLESLYKAAYAIYGEGSAEALEMVKNHLRMLLEGKVGFVIGALKQTRTKYALRGGRRTTVEKVIGYLDNNRQYMKYDEYLAAGHPIGSGVAEGACRHLVKDRMEGTGMHWTVDGAQAMLDVRSTYLNGDWQAFAEFRAQKTASGYAKQIAILNRVGRTDHCAAS